MHSANGEGPSHGDADVTVDVAADGGLSLRERKKLATRQALSAAAIRLAVEQGFDSLRVEDIAEAAGVSPRTFNNYFSSKEEAICAARITQSERLAAALRARPRDEPLIDALIDVFRAEHIREPSRAVFRLMHSTPALSGEFLRSAMAAEAPLIEAIAHRTGTDPAKDLLPRVAAAAIFGAMRVSIQQWMCVADSPPYVTVLGDALNQLRALTTTTHHPVSDHVSAASAQPDTMNDRAA